MSRINPMPFQKQHIRALLSRFRALKSRYDALGKDASEVELNRLRRADACVLLQAPTGIGKTLIACELLSQFSAEERVLWLWFAPFAGVIGQAKTALTSQAPNLTQLDIESGRRAENLLPGATFVLTWQTVAARSKDSRLARQNGEAGLAIDDLLAQARHEDFRIGVVVDEAHHGFVRASEASKFFANVVQPDFVLMMTATPRDADAEKFSQQTGYRIGGPSEWASITRKEGVDAQLLKQSVKAARFIAKNHDDAQLLAFEEVALSECATMHRRIKETLADSGIGLTPLMLVQVPNGGQALQKAREYLTGPLKFADEAVRVHTADEPDPSLAALADDPQVEVIIFKMAIATGFDAPRAFTLAALRGNRDIDFGIQVVGRIMRVHRLLQGKLASVPPILNYGYVFLANSEAQEGLVGAAARINQMPQQLASASPSTVVTVLAGSATVQVVHPGESLSLLHDESSTAPEGLEPSEDEGVDDVPLSALTGTQAALFETLAPDGRDVSQKLVHGFAETSPLTHAFELEAQSGGQRYSLKEGMPSTLVTEKLPAAPDDVEERLVAHIDFSKMLGDRYKVRSRVTERVEDVFSKATPEDHDVWANVSPAAIAERARQIAFEFDELDRRQLLLALKERFKSALQDEGHELPDSEEQLTRQLELVLVRNEGLIRQAYKRVRAENVEAVSVQLPSAIESLTPLLPAKRNIYGVFPDSLSPQELEFAEYIDSAKEVVWWHRNPVHKPESVSLYQWSGGIGFFPDFVIGIAGRSEGGGVALLELKGPQLQQYDRAKAAACHITYGRVFMVGKEGRDGGFRLWRLVDDRLVDDGPFETHRLRYS
ncbi:DEAD/DEAH box helicase [Burkholderia sp. BCC1993]|uniref:DEAD/DEAH box helicase n=1 Tax=Burkholderia sp. BCC1993 TaxID=2817444 RepID=UPI002AB1BE08|nr:DEAD/DEAH box helicase family protein [Burkholderia sp. BCC1993]